MMWLLLAAFAIAQVQIQPPPTQGSESTITLINDAGQPRAGIGIRVVQRPGLPGESRASLGLTDSMGRVNWTPAAAGTAVVHAGAVQLPLVVATSSPPTTTLALLGVLTLAGLIAMGAGMTRRRQLGRSYRSRH